MGSLLEGGGAMGEIKILLAEDHLVVREGLRRLLEAEPDMRVIAEAASGEEAVRQSRTASPDLVLMDISLPGLNGIEATRRIKAERPGVSVLVLSAYDNEEFIFAVLEAGAAGYLLKNMRGQEIVNAIRAVTDGDSVLHPQVAGKLLRRLQGAGSSGDRRKKEVLSRRELEVLQLGARGLANKEIAARLDLSERTIQTHWRNIFVKLGVSSRMEAVMHALKNDYISLERTADE
jgi:DNA-binding NarL/FixJ family response regulator